MMGEYKNPEEKRVIVRNYIKNNPNGDPFRFNSPKTLEEAKLLGLGLGLYWGEGYKKGNNECGFTNSDPDIILLIIRWFQKIYSIDKKDFILRVSINEMHKKRDLEIR